MEQFILSFKVKLLKKMEVNYHRWDGFKAITWNGTFGDRRSGLSQYFTLGFRVYNDANILGTVITRIRLEQDETVTVGGYKTYEQAYRRFILCLLLKRP